MPTPSAPFVDTSVAIGYVWTLIPSLGTAIGATVLLGFAGAIALLPRFLGWFKNALKGR
jgi:hypothetical protein